MAAVSEEPAPAAHSPDHFRSLRAAEKLALEFERPVLADSLRTWSRESCAESVSRVFLSLPFVEELAEILPWCPKDLVGVITEFTMTSLPEWGRTADGLVVYDNIVHVPATVKSGYRNAYVDYTMEIGAEYSLVLYAADIAHSEFSDFRFGIALEHDFGFHSAVATKANAVGHYCSSGRLHGQRVATGDIVEFRVDLREETMRGNSGKGRTSLYHNGRKLENADHHVAATGPVFPMVTLYFSNITVGLLYCAEVSGTPAELYERWKGEARTGG